MKYVTIGLALVVAACSSGPSRDYESSRACVTRGFKADTPEFEACVKEERSARLLEQQRQFHEKQRQYEEQQKAYRGIYR